MPTINDLVVQTAASDVVRDAHYALDSVSGLYVRTLLLEKQRTNLVLYSSDQSNAAWSKNAGVTVTPNAVVAPDGTLTANLIEGLAASNGVFQASLPVSTTVESSKSVWLRSVSGTGTVRFRDTHLGGTVGLTTRTLTTTWQRFSLVEVMPGGISGPYVYGGGTLTSCYIWNAQLEDAPFVSSDIITAGSATTRASDSLSLPYTDPPQSLTLYVRGNDRGSSQLALAGIATIGSLINTAPLFCIYAASGVYGAQHKPGSNVTSTVAAPTPGDAVEIRATLSDQGAVQIGVSSNEGAETLGALSAGLALAGAWQSQNLLVNGLNSITQGFFEYRTCFVARGVRDMAWCRAEAYAMEA